MSKAIVSLSGVNFRYQGRNTAALRDINLQVEQGEFICITGSSGCGKSTLALCMSGFIPHNVAGEMRGSVIINGMDSRHYTPSQLAGSIGLVQQDPEAQLCTLKVMDEVAFGPENLCLKREEIKDRVEWALAAVNSWHLREREVYSLSGGEKQRIAIASILTMQPELIILDEPTANLDPAGTSEVLQVIRQLGQKTSVIIIEHRLKQLLPIADRLLLMDEGRIIGDGEPEQIYQEYCRRFRSYFTVFAEAERGESPGASVDKKLSRPEPVLRVQELDVKLGGKRILEDISFDLYPGEVTAVMGGNGSGKTTLLLSLLGINKADGGHIFYRNKNITGEKVSRRARNMSLVFQNPNHQIFENTVWREAILPSEMLLGEQDLDDRINFLLTEYDMLAYRDTLPFSLSLGEKKRLTLISVLGYQPEILLLDEPLIGQDKQRVDKFWHGVWKHRQAGGSTLIVCHDPDFVQEFCDRILFLDQGKLLVCEPVKEGFKILKELGFKDYLPGSPVMKEWYYG
jgi:energy-coupling factor transporter ATP-binding protein EcfA2